MRLLNRERFLNTIGFTDKGSYKYRYRNPNNITVYWDALPSGLDDKCFLLLMMLASLADGNNVLSRRVSRKSKFSTIVYKPMDKEDIRDSLKWKFGENKFDKCWTELKKHCIKQIKYYDDRLFWVINPAFVNRCRSVPYWLYKEFSVYMNPYMTKLAINKMHDIITENERIINEYNKEENN